MTDYKTYLAASILTEDKVVTYRLLSRVLKVHVNAAKEYLFEFHRLQNAKKPGTIHATYLLSGTRKEEEPATNGDIKKDGEDDYMQSSPFVSSSMPQPQESTGEVSVLSITLVKEEDLEVAQSLYEHITSIQVYSIGPHPLKDLQLLSDVTREIHALTKDEDPLEFAPKYGTITNPNVRRRTARRPPPQVALPSKAIPSKASQPKEALKPSKPEPKASQPSTAKDFFGKGKPKVKAEPTSAPSSKESTPAPPPALKRESSSIFKSFAKAKPKLKREETTESSAADSPMRDVDDEDEEETYVPPEVDSKEVEKADKSRKERKEREEKLRRMMEDDDDEEEEEEVKDEATPDAEPMEEEVKEEVKEPVVTVSGGRRRGRRRVMKKKTVKDEEGYLVTKEEAAWESFSEDEPAVPTRAKPQASASAAKAKKAATKPGQGNIMSFFGKK